jgi:hypothetical protein
MYPQNLRLVDGRFGDGPRYYLSEPKDIDMRVPDQIRNTVMFVRTEEDDAYIGTAFVVTVPGANDNHFGFTVTARHVAERLQGTNYSVRINRRNGSPVVLRGKPDDPWWYHPTERGHVDAAVTFFSPAYVHLAQLEVEHIPIGMFADEDVIRQRNIGVGDEVFITGLFTKVQETTKNIPIVRTGTVAMIPGERIPFGDSLIEAYLVESRSIGGLSGSPVFVRETLGVSLLDPAKMPIRNLPTGTHTLPDEYLQQMHGVSGRFYFFGSMIGHWEVPPGFTMSQSEAVNMGVAPIVPAHKIKEIILQPEMMKIMKEIDAEMRARNQTGARLDFAPSEKSKTQITDGGATIPVPSEEQFFELVMKASRKVNTSKT